MKTFEVRLVEVYHVEAENEDEAFDLVTSLDDGLLTDEQRGRVDYRHGDDTIKEI